MKPKIRNTLFAGALLAGCTQPIPEAHHSAETLRTTTLTTVGRPESITSNSPNRTTSPGTALGAAHRPTTTQPETTTSSTISTESTTTTQRPSSVTAVMHELFAVLPVVYNKTGLKAESIRTDGTTVLVTLMSGRRACAEVVAFNAGHHYVEPNPSTVVESTEYGTIKALSNPAKSFGSEVGHSDNQGVQPKTISGPPDILGSRAVEIADYVASTYQVTYLDPSALPANLQP